MLNLYPTWLDTIHTLNKWRGARKQVCDEQYDKVFSTSGRLFFKLHSSCRCFCTNDCYSALQASTSLPWIHLFSKKPSNRMRKSWIEAWSSPPIEMAGQKQLISCPKRDRHARLKAQVSKNFQGTIGQYVGSWSEIEMVWQHELLPLLHKRQGAVLFQFLQNAVHKAGKFRTCVVAIIWRRLWVDAIFSKLNYKNKWQTEI